MIQCGRAASERKARGATSKPDIATRFASAAMSRVVPYDFRQQPQFGTQMALLREAVGRLADGIERSRTDSARGSERV